MKLALSILRQRLKAITISGIIFSLIVLPFFASDPFVPENENTLEEETFSIDQPSGNSGNCSCVFISGNDLDDIGDIPVASFSLSESVVPSEFFPFEPPFRSLKISFNQLSIPPPA